MVCGVPYDVAVDGGIASVKEPLWFTFKVGEVLVGILVVYLVEAVWVACAERVEDHVFAGLVVVYGFGSPHADDVLPFLSVSRREVDGGVLPIDEVSRLEQHHASVA